MPTTVVKAPRRQPRVSMLAQPVRLFQQERVVIDLTTPLAAKPKLKSKPLIEYVDLSTPPLRPRKLAPPAKKQIKIDFVDLLTPPPSPPRNRPFQRVVQVVDLQRPFKKQAVVVDLAAKVKAPRASRPQPAAVKVAPKATVAAKAKVTAKATVAKAKISVKQTTKRVPAPAPKQAAKKTATAAAKVAPKKRAHRGGSMASSAVMDAAAFDHMARISSNLVGGKTGGYRLHHMSGGSIWSDWMGTPAAPSGTPPMTLPASSATWSYQDNQQPTAITPSSASAASFPAYLNTYSPRLTSSFN